jgi:transcriptional regulator with XRE-family HTH domain
LTQCRKKGKISCNVRQRQRRPTLEALRRARVDAGLTISELAKRAGVSRDTISHAERGRHSLQGPTLSKIARALGRVPSELLAEEERLSPKAPRRSSLEPSLNDVLEEERQIGAAKTFTDNLNHFAHKWREEAKAPENQGVHWCLSVQATAIGLTDLFGKLGCTELIARKIAGVGKQSPDGLIEEMKKGESGRAMSDPDFVVAMDLLKAFEDMHNASDHVLEADEAVDWITVKEAEQRRKAFSVIQGDLSA